jgi:hypothetical protein
MAAPGFADVIDPQLFVCTGCTSSVGGDPNFISSGSFNVGFAGSGQSAVSPILILVAIPGTGAAPTLSLPTGVSAAAALAYYGLNNATSGNLTGVLEGTLTATSPSPPNNNAYAAAGILNAGGGNSQNFANYTTTPFPGGQPNPDTGVTQFRIFAYAINFALNDSNSPLKGINLEGGSLIGDFVMAYNCATGGGTAVCSGGDIGSTPFTVGGFIGPTGVPLPAALPLFATGLVGLGLLARRRKRAIAA